MTVLLIPPKAFLRYYYLFKNSSVRYARYYLVAVIYSDQFLSLYFTWNVHDFSDDAWDECGSKAYFLYDVGELLGVATVATAAVLGVAALMLNYPDVFNALKWIGGAYLIFCWDTNVAK